MELLLMDSLHDLLASRDFDEPTEVMAIKKFVRDNYQSEVGVTVREREISLAVSSAALASSLRMNIVELQKAAQTDKRILIRIS